VVVAKPRDLIFKPREQWHTLWNAGDAPARGIGDHIARGLPNYFRELGAELVGGPLIRSGLLRFARLRARHGLEQRSRPHLAVRGSLSGRSAGPALNSRCV
jgi:hypothetical protein